VKIVKNFNKYFDNTDLIRDTFVLIEDPLIQKYKLVKPNCNLQIVIDTDYITCIFIKATEQQKGYGSEMMDAVEYLAYKLKKGVLYTYPQFNYVVEWLEKRGYFKLKIIDEDNKNAVTDGTYKDYFSWPNNCHMYINYNSLCKKFGETVEHEYNGFGL